MKGDVSLNWNDLLNIEKYTPLSELGLSATQAEQEEQLLKVNSNMYIVNTPFNNDSDLAEKSDRPFFAGFFWAASEDAMQRIFNFKIEEDEKSLITGQAPSELLLGAKSNQYQDILTACRNHDQSTSETASYRLIPDGLFNAREISTLHHTFYFRGSDDNFADEVFAIQVRPKL